jgi:phosphoglycolate phosphatase
LLIFDLDGTLVDSRADLAAGINHMRTHFGLRPLPLDTVAGYIGSGVRNLVKRSLQGADVPFEEALSINRAYYNAHLVVHTCTYPGVHSGIRTLAEAGHKLAVLSNKPGDSSRAIIRHFGLDGFFTTIIGGGDVEKLKPAPDGVYECFAASGLDGSAAWMIGDHHTDLVVAKNAGIKSAFASYGFGDILDHKADARFDSFAELVQFYI